MANQFDLVRIPPDPRSQLATPTYAPPVSPVAVAGTSNEYYWKQVLRVLRKHWPVSLFFIVVSVTALVGFSLLLRDVYEAKARVEIMPPPARAIYNIREGSATPIMSEADYFQTQLEVLKSDALAIGVIRNVQLDKKSEIVGKAKQRSWKEVLHLDRIFKKPSRSPLELALASFRGRLSVDQIRNSRMVEVRFGSGNPQLAAQVTNELLSLYLERTHRAGYEATMKAAESLKGEMEELRTGVRKANDALLDFQNAHGILDFREGDSTTGAGAVSQSPITQRVAELNRQLTQAQAERLNQQAFVKLIDSGSAESLPQMRDNLVLQDLTKRYIEARAQLAQAMAVFGQNNPNARKLQNQVDELGAQLTAERQKIVAQVRTGYQAAVNREQLLSQTLTQMKGTQDSANEKMIRYTLLRREAQANADLYITLSARLKEAAIAGSLHANNIRVVDQARVPERPAKPNRLQIIALGLVISVVCGVGLAFLRESFDDTVSSHLDVRACTGLPSLAMFPLIVPVNHQNRMRMALRPGRLLGDGRKTAQDPTALRFFLERPRSAEAEAVRSLVTSIRVPTRPDGDHVRTLLIVSPFPNEGKTTVAINLATALAQHGRTCLVDADLRNPMVAQSFGLSSQHGLQDVLAGAVPLKDALRLAPKIPNLTILPAAPVESNPGELIASELMIEVLRGIREGFDHVVIDSAPVIPYADARWLSSQADGVVIVARSGTTTRQAMVWSTELLFDVQAPVLGVVLNGVDLQRDYYGYGAYK